MEQESLIYPLGRMVIPLQYSAASVKDAIDDIRVLPRILDYCVENLDEAHLHTPYRDGGWTPNQIIHHLADSHMNAFVRTKLLLTENQPVVKPYSQDDWALTADVSNVPVNYSITIIHALHHRWVGLLETLNKQEMMRTYFHPEYNKTVALWEVVHTYGWHGKHHAEQIRQLKIRNNW